jgi:hypothetical protein
MDKKPRSKYRPTTTWKHAEAKILAFWPNGKRRGAYVSDGRQGMPDNGDSLTGWSIESKHSRRPTYGLMAEAVSQAEANRIKPDDIPVAVIHKEGERYEDSLVVMRLSEFQKYFINSASE